MTTLRGRAVGERIGEAMTDIEASRTTAPPTTDVGPSVSPCRAREPGVTVYDAIAETIARLGWARGRAVARHGSGDLLRAVRGTLDPEGRSRGADVARVARIRNHLSELLPASRLTAWNDDPARTLAD